MNLLQGITFQGVYVPGASSFNCKQEINYSYECKTWNGSAIINDYNPRDQILAHSQHILHVGFCGCHYFTLNINILILHKITLFE